MFIDSHCHLHFEPLAQSLPQKLSNMLLHQVDAALSVSVTLPNFAQLYTFVQDHPQLFCSIGSHPDKAELCTFQQLLTATALPKTIAIGETGLDYYRPLPDNATEQFRRNEQQERFLTHIHAANQSNLPLIVHTRMAAADTLSLLRTHLKPGIRGVMHCFTESYDFAKEAIDLGFMISFSGILTFKNATDLQTTAKKLPSESLLIETDAPYLAPVPHRGSTNEPAFVRYVAECLATLRGESTATIAHQTSENFYTLFTKARQIKP